MVDVRAVVDVRVVDLRAPVDVRVAVDLRADVAFLVRGVAGPFERRSASSSAARSGVIVSGSAPRGRLALVSPSVT